MTDDEEYVADGELNLIRSDLDSIAKYSFEYMIKKEKLNRKDLNKARGYQRYWLYAD